MMNVEHVVGKRAVVRSNRCHDRKQYCALTKMPQRVRYRQVAGAHWVSIGPR